MAKTEDNALDTAVAKGQALDNSVVFLEGYQLGAFEKRLDSLNKKAKAFGLDPIRIISSEEVAYMRHREYIGRDNENMSVSLVPWKPDPDSFDDEPPMMLTKVRIEYPIVKLGHWRVVGKLEAVEGGNLAFSITQNDDDKAAIHDRADHPVECDHCKKKRNRKDGFILRDDDTGAYMQVGGSCLEDFTGIDPAAALFLARMHSVFSLASEDLDEFARSGRTNAVETRRYLAGVSFLSSHFGFVSTAKARDMCISATYEDARHLGSMLRESPKLQDLYDKERDHHLAVADAIREWFSTKPVETDYDRNARLLLANDAISTDRKHLAFAAGTIPAYNRYLGVKAEAKRPSEHVGKPGEKMERILRIDRIIEIETAFGPSRLVLMTDEGGNKFKWKTSAAPYEVANGVGRSMRASFKVKQHDDYNGTAQTAVTHLRPTEWLELESSAQQDALATAATVDAGKSMYHFALFQHPAGGEKDFSNELAEHRLDLDALVALAHRMQISAVSPECTKEHIWYASTSTQDGDAPRDSYSLHIRDVNGAEPTDDDYERVTRAIMSSSLSIQASHELDSDARP